MPWAETLLVNPVEPARLGGRGGRGNKMALPVTSKKPPTRPRTNPTGKRRSRRNPGLEGFVRLLFPIVAGGGVGYLEARAKDPDWWRNLDYDKEGKPRRWIKPLIFVAIAVVAKRMNNAEVYGAAMALAGVFAGRAMKMAYDEKAAAAGVGGADVPPAGVDMPEGLAGMLGDNVDRELEAAYRQLQAKGGVRAELGALPHQNDNFEVGLGDIVDPLNALGVDVFAAA